MQQNKDIDLFREYIETVRELVGAKNEELANFIKYENLEASFYNHDNWDGGIDYYNITLNVPTQFYQKIESENKIEDYTKEIEKNFASALNSNNSLVVENVTISPNSKVTDTHEGLSDLKFTVTNIPPTKTPTGVFKLDKKNLDGIDLNNPCYILNFNSGWNDNFKYLTSFEIIKVDSNNNIQSIGFLKIMKENEGNTYNCINKQFSYLDDQFCSLGYDNEYYKSLLEKLGKDETIRVLRALNDCALDHKIYERFHEQDGFKFSLKRYLEAERAIREALFIINNNKSNDAYSFSYEYKYDTSGASTTWNVKFLSDDEMPFGRSVGIIGDNGAGKTTLLRNIIKDLRSEDKGGFQRKPFYSSVIVISTTKYDKYEDLKEIKRYDCPIEVYSLDLDNSFAEEFLIESIERTLKRGEKQTNILKKMYEEVCNNQTLDFLDGKNFDVEKFHKTLISISSGQRHLLHLITHICSKVWYDTLFVLDEPEVHLHPHAVMNFFRVFSNILQRFESYCLVATHSPLVVREMIGKNVFIIRKMQDDVRCIQNIGIETFGENIATLHQKIFDYDETQSNFYRIVENLVKRGKQFEEIVEELTTSNFPLSISSRMIIQSVIEKERVNEKY